MIAIDTGKIEAMAAQMRSTVARMQEAASTQGSPPVGEAKTSGLDFAQALTEHLSSLHQLQSNAQLMGRKFVSGEDSVQLSDVMIASQKASITLQATVQVRNKLISAYQDIMNMQI